MSDTKAPDPTGKSPDRRKLIAVLYADMVGYSRLIGSDDVGTLKRLRSIRSNLIDPAIAEHGGRIVNTGGDSLLMVFDSVDGAVRCAVKVQQQVPAHDGDLPPDQAIRFRVGINVGDVIPDGTDVHGDVVNVAARLQAECPPGGICVTRPVRDHVRGRFDLTFDDIGALNLKNIAYPVEAFVLKVGDGAARRPSAEAVAEPLALPDGPSVAVLPFSNLSGDPEQGYFADGMVEEIITSLSRIRWLFVIARNSSFTYRGQQFDAKRIGRELGVRYILEGSVRKGSGRVRITAQLIEAATGVHLWADHFDGSLEDVFKLQDDVAVAVAGVIEPTLETAEVRRASERPTADLTAYDLYLRALPHCFSWEKERVTYALDLLNQAILRDSRYGPALALAAWCHLLFDNNNWAEDATANRQNGVQFARQALQITSEEPIVLTNAAFVLAYFGEDIDSSIRLLERVLALNPSSAWAWLLYGFLNLWAGRTDVVIPQLERSMRLNPRGHRAFRLTGIGIALFFDRRFVEALDFLLVSIKELPSYVATYRFAAACYGHLRRLTEAADVIARARQLTPVLVPDAAFYRNPDQRELYLSGLRIAMGESV